MKRLAEMACLPRCFTRVRVLQPTKRKQLEQQPPGAERLLRLTSSETIHVPLNTGSSQMYASHEGFVLHPKKWHAFEVKIIGLASTPAEMCSIVRDSGQRTATEYKNAHIRM